MPRPLFPPVFAPNVSHPLVDDFALRAARMRERAQPAGVPASFTLPMRNNPMWTGNNELGNEVGFAPDANNRQMVLKLEEWDFPQTWKVMLGSTYTMPTDNNEQKWNVRAEVQVGAGGVVQEFQVDWMEGTTFTVVANSIIINARFYNIESAFDSPQNLRLRASVGRGEASEGALATITEQVTVPNGGASPNPLIRIPAFARYLSVMDRAPSATDTVFAATTLIQYLPTTAGLTFLIGGCTGPQALAMGNRIPIPAVARALRFTNGGANPLDIKAIFSIEP